jgi:hypothetical protein
VDAGAEPATVARWITETEAERARYQAAIRALPSQADRSMSRDEITSTVTVLSDLRSGLVGELDPQPDAGFTSSSFTGVSERSRP